MSSLTIPTLKSTISRSKDDYFVGILTALPIERAAVTAMLDEEHQTPFDFKRHPLDSNSYTWGTISEHNIVLASLSAGIYGPTSATSTVLPMKYAFPGIKWGLMVGIAAGIPSDERDIRLGDVVVSQPKDGSSGVFQYDFGKVRDNDDWQSVGWLARPPEILLKALANLQSVHELHGPYRAQQNLRDAVKSHPDWGMRYGFPHGQIDRLFLASYTHKKSSKECTACDTSMVVERSERHSSDFHIHYGVVASGNSLVKDAHFRDKIARRMNQCICLEMEAAGMMNDFPCLVIRGICDYADSHKNDNWQRYASATAAAFAKELLSSMSAVDSGNEGYRVRTDIQTAGDDFDDFKITDTTSTKSNKAAVWETSVVELESSATPYELDDTEIIRQANDATSTVWTKIPGAYDDIWDTKPETHATIDHLDRLEFMTQEEDATSTITSNVAATGDMHEVMSMQDQLYEFPSTNSITDLAEHNKKSEEIREVSPANATDKTDIHYTLGIDSIKDQHRRSWSSFYNDLIESFEREEGACQTGLATTIDEAAAYNIGVESINDQEREPPSMSSTTINPENHEGKGKTYSSEPVSILITEASNLTMDVHKSPAAEAKDGSGSVSSRGDLTGTENNSALQTNELYLATPEVQQKTESTSTEHLEVVSNQSTHPLITTVQDTPEAVQSNAILKQSSREHLMITPAQEISEPRYNHKTHDKSSNSAMPTIEAPDRTPKVPPPAKEREAPSGDLKNPPSAKDKEVPNQVPRNPLLAEDGKASDRIPSKTPLAKDKKAVNDPPNIDKKLDSNNTTLLHKAATKGDYDKVKTLLDRGANIHAKNIRGTMPLHFAAIHGKAQVVGLLLDRKANIEARGGSENCTALHLAASADQPEVVRLLLDRKANLENTSARKWTTLHFAVHHGHVEMTRLLLGQGANLEARGSNHYTALHFAAAENHVDVVKLLLRRKANLKAVTADKRTALHIAASEGHEEMVECLLEQKAEIEARDIEGKTALHIAACNNHMDVIRLLLGRKAKLNVGDDNGKTALHHAVSEGHTDIVSLLLYRKAPLEFETTGGKTALHYAVCKDSVDLVKLLLQHRANLEAVAKGKWRALHFAAFKGYVEMVELLLAVGADPRVKTEQHCRPADLAKKQGHEEIVQLLKDYGGGPRPALFRF